MMLPLTRLWPLLRWGTAAAAEGAAAGGSPTTTTTEEEEEEDDDDDEDEDGGWRQGEARPGFTAGRWAAAGP